MAPSVEENYRQEKQDDANPFVLFRRFADQQISTLMNTVFNTGSSFGSSSASSRQSIDDYEKWLQEARESSRRLTREAEEADRIMDVYTRAQQDGQCAARDPINDDNNNPLRNIFSHREGHWVEKPDVNICLLNDATRSCSSLAALSLCLPSTVIHFPRIGNESPSVPVAYLLCSPYSPVRLEQQPRLSDYGVKWREAFEDLLAAQSGQELTPKSSQRAHESSLDWLRGMINLAMHKREENAEDLNSAIIRMSEAFQQDSRPLSRILSIRQPTNHANEDDDADNDELGDQGEAEFTEMTMYDRLLGRQQPSSDSIAGAAARSFAHSQQDSSSSDKDRENSSILSTLTTTERTTLPDGSMHTKVVLKKRFADGREESTETVHHHKAIRQTQDAASSSVEDEGMGKIGTEKTNRVNKYSGWFWS